MKSPGLLRTGALIEIARILMQKRWQNGVADQASGNGIGEASSQPLAIPFRTLMPFARIVTSLGDARPRCRTRRPHSGMWQQERRLLFRMFLLPHQARFRCRICPLFPPA